MHNPKYPATLRQHRQFWLWKEPYVRTHGRNQSWSAVFVGPTGSGKSYSALALAWLLDRTEDDKPRFSIDKVCFSAAEFAGLMAKNWEQGECILIDDAALNVAYNRESMTKIVRRISQIFMSMRYKNLIVLLSLPSFSMLDLNVRQLLHGYFQTIKIDREKQMVQCKYHILQCDSRHGTLYHHRPEQVYWTEVGGISVKHFVKINSLLMDKPPEELIAAYEQKKKNFLDAWNQETIKKIEEAEHGKKRENTFQKFFEIVSAHPKKYADTSKPFLRIDAGKIISLHPEAGVFNAKQIACMLNKELKGREKKG